MLQLETAQDRMARQKKLNTLIMGKSGVGKTYLARTLPPETTLFADAEAGTLSLEKSKDQPAWQGTTLNLRKESQKLGVHPWELCRALACILAGPDPAAKDGPYSFLSYQQYVNVVCGGNATMFDHFQNIFVDSVTVVSRWCLDWAKKQPEAFSEKTGKPDTRGAYGVLGQELVMWATQLQHQPKNIILSCILEEEMDEFKRVFWNSQIEGKQAGKKLPGIFDLVMTLAWVDFGEPHGKQRVLITQENNEFGYPAKDRSGLLEKFERPDLGAIIAKIQNFNVNTVSA